jgi:hypothetical protein
MTLYYTAAGYYGWKPAEGGLRTMLPSNWQLGLLGLLGIIVLMSTWALIAVQIGWIAPQPQFNWQNNPPHILVAGKRFTNERVPLDGYIYRDCIFENVTFVFNGTDHLNLAAII